MFRSPFSLQGVEGLQPAGIYEIEIEDELLEPLSFTAYHRLSTSLILPIGKHSHQIVRIDATDLAEAQRRDAATSATAS